MTVGPARIRRSRRNRAEARVVLQPYASDEGYKVGPGRPPREFQFKPGQSGNPKGGKRKPQSIAPDLKALLENALSGKVTLRQGDKERIVTKAAAGIEQMVNQFAQGDRYARRDLIDLALTLGVDLTADRGQANEKALEPTITADDEALVADFLKRKRGQHHHDGDELDRPDLQSDPTESPSRNEDG
jgi:Family of unknown function (DUF5681)